MSMIEIDLPEFDNDKGLVVMYDANEDEFYLIDSDNDTVATFNSDAIDDGSGVSVYSIIDDILEEIDGYEDDRIDEYRLYRDDTYYS